MPNCTEQGMACTLSGTTTRCKVHKGVAHASCKCDTSTKRCSRNNKSTKPEPKPRGSSASGKGKGPLNKKIPMVNELEVFGKAVRSGNVDKVREMLNNNSRLAITMVNVRGGRYDKPLVLAAYGGHLEIVKLLLRNGAKKPSEINYGEGGSGSALFWAVSMGNLEIVKLLLDAGADIKNSSARFIKFLYDNPREFPNKEYNKLIRKNFKPMNPRTNCEVDVFGGNYRLSKTNITRTSPSKPNRLLVWVAIPTPSNTPRNEKYERTKYDCLSLEKYIEIVNFKDNIHPITRKKIQTHRVRFYYVDPTAVKSAATKIQAVVRGHRTRSRIVKSRTNSNTSSSSRTNSRFGKGKGPQKRPSSAVCTRAQKLGIRLTLKRNNKRVYKSEEMLRKQIKNAVTKRKQKK